MAAYLNAVTKMQRQREAYEAELWETGAGDLTLGTVVDRDGDFHLDGVPEGQWLLYASRFVFNDAPWRTPPRRDVRSPSFLKAPSVVGHYVVTVWLRDVMVRGGMPKTVDLTDRNAWFVGVVEVWEEVWKPEPRTKGPGKSPRGVPTLR